jgi:hypothetical protein
MDSAAVGRGLVQKFGGSKKQATAHAKAAVMRSDIQQRLESTGGFVWHVEMWPNWLQISVDALGNREEAIRDGEKVADRWVSQNEGKLNEMFSELLGPQFGELAILGRPMGAHPQAGNCCRLGCSGCINGAHDKLKAKLAAPEQLGDRYL